jgi:hypothetical protein
MALENEESSMSSTLTTALAAIAILGGAATMSTPASAWGGHGGHGMHGHGGHGGHWKHHRPRWHVHYRHYRPYYRPIYAAIPAVRTVRGPCTCLTKEYTPEGTVIFKDLCTNEMAQAPVPGRPSAEAPRDSSQVAPQAALPAQGQVAQAPPDPSNYGGRTYQEFMASQGAPK